MNTIFVLFDKTERENSSVCKTKYYNQEHPELNIEARCLHNWFSRRSKWGDLNFANACQLQRAKLFAPLKKNFLSLKEFSHGQPDAYYVVVLTVMNKEDRN